MAEAQIDLDCESGSGLREAISKIMGVASMKSGEMNLLKAGWLDTPLGPMLAVSDEEALYLLEFMNCRGLEAEIEKLKETMNSVIVPGQSKPIASIQEEISKYFKGKLVDFKTPFKTRGSPFQERVWAELQNIPYGESRSYVDIAKALKDPAAVRAVGGANGANRIAILIPCHRVINANGEIGGYAGGVDRKKWLLAHESKARKL